MIQILESLLRLDYEPGFEPLSTMVADVGIQAISTHIEGGLFEVPIRGYFDNRNEKIFRGQNLF